MTRLAIFDCDGTLVDSHANICLCMERTFERAGLAAPPREAIRRLVGLSLSEFVAELVPAGDPELQRALVDGYRATFTELREGGAMDREPLFEGIAPLLAELAEAGWLLGVATGKSDRGLARVLADHDIARHFTTLQTADRHPSKPNPAMIAAALAETGVDADMAVMIGDTSYDIFMARAAGVRSVGVGWGYHDADELIEAGADAVVMAVPELTAQLMPR